MALTKINNNTLSAVTTLPSAIATGRVLQVVTTTSTSSFSTTSSSFANTSRSVAITPSSTSNKVFISVNGAIDNDSATQQPVATIYRDSTNIGASSLGIAKSYSSGSRIIVPSAMSILDSPSSTSEITYAVYLRSHAGGTSGFGGGEKVTITAFEIAG